MLRSLLVLSLLAQPGAQDEVARSSEPDLWQVAGLVLPSVDLELDASFYSEALGWQIDREGKESTVLRMGEMLLVLDSLREPVTEDPRSSLYINLRVADIERTAARVLDQGGSAVDERAKKFVLGMSRTMRDPSGNVFNLIRLEGETLAGSALPALFNLGVHMAGMDALRKLFVDRLGFVVYSDDYLPRTLPLQPRGALSLVLHDDAHGSWITDRSAQHGCGSALLLAVGDPESLLGQEAASSELVERETEHCGRLKLQTDESGIELAFAATGNIPRAVPVQGESKSGR